MPAMLYYSQKLLTINLELGVSDTLLYLRYARTNFNRKMILRRLVNASHALLFSKTSYDQS
jgi:hypothetical protein